MTCLRLSALAALLLGLLASPASAQTAPPDRVPLFGKDLFLNGGNVAWINFSADVGPGATNLEGFRQIFEEVHANGGNAMRLWLHTNGKSTPEWSASTVGQVVGPGAGTIDDIGAILDIAEENEVGVQLCLWSFDMLRQSYGAANEERARALLTSAALTQTYIDTALTPMVTALKDHPALLAWEIFNEPEGMSIEYAFQGLVQRPVPMTDIQRFTNQLAGAIHRADPEALVTNGSVNFRTLTDNQQGAGGRANYNYYGDDRLVAQGGDALGTLDYYSVHYYTTNVPPVLSPFTNDASVWGLDKPIVVGEFYAPDVTPNGVAFGDLYTTLYNRGYAGAMIWQHADRNSGDPVQAQNWPRGLQNMATMLALHPADVEVVLAGPDITAFTADDAQITAGGETTLRWSVTGATEVTLNGAVVAATATQTVAPAETTTYTLAARDAGGATRQRVVTVRVVPPTPANRYEAEDAALVGVGIGSDLPAASGGKYVKMENGGSITWAVEAPVAGDYTVRFGYYLPFEFKAQFLDVNGVRVDTVGFDPPITTFLSTTAQVSLNAGTNTIALSKFYGYMNVDYLDVQVPVAGESGPGAAGALRVTSAPNPFSTTTRLRYTLAADADVTVDVFDVTGRRVARLAAGPVAAGPHEVPFDAAALPSGVYVARVTAGAQTETRRLLVVR